MKKVYRYAFRTEDNVVQFWRDKPLRVERSYKTYFYLGGRYLSLRAIMPHANMRPIEEVCYESFHRITGITMKPGQVIKLLTNGMERVAVRIGKPPQNARSAR